MTTPTPTLTSALAWKRAVKPEDPDAEYLTLQEFAYVLRISPQTLRRRIADGARHTRPEGTRRILFSRKDREHYQRIAQAGRQTRQRAA